MKGDGHNDEGRLTFGNTLLECMGYENSSAALDSRYRKV